MSGCDLAGTSRGGADAGLQALVPANQTASVDLPQRQVEAAIFQVLADKRKNPAPCAGFIENL